MRRRNGRAPGAPKSQRATEKYFSGAETWHNTAKTHYL